MVEEENVNKEEVKEEQPQRSQEVRTPTAIEVAEKLHGQIKAENDRHEELLIRQENLKAEAILGGQSEAGKTEPEPVDPEQVVKDRCNKLLEGLDMKI